MAKKRRTATVPPIVRPSKEDRRERIRHLMIAGLIGLAAVVIGLTALGVYLSQKSLSGSTALAVGDTEYSTGYILQRVRLLIKENAQQGVDFPPDLAISQTLLTVQDEGIIRQEAANLGISVTPDELDLEIGDRLGVPVGDTQSFTTVYKQELKRTGLSSDEYRRMVEAALLREKALADYRQNAPVSAPQVNIRLIQVGSRIEAENALNRLQAGESFGDVARQVSLDFASREDGGERGWTPRGIFEDAFDRAVFALEPGQRSGPIVGSQFAYVVEMIERTNDLALTEEQRGQLASRSFVQWLAGKRGDGRVESHVDGEKTNWLLERASS